MVIFRLTLLKRNTWNGRWSGDERVLAKVRHNREVPKEVVGKSFYHSWDDGWIACVDVEKIGSREADKLMKKSDGFCGYDWMIESIIRYGEIRYKRDWR